MGNVSILEIKTLEQKIAELPENLKLKVEGYIDALMEERNTPKSASSIYQEVSNSPKTIFGSGKETFRKMADDFDAPPVIVEEKKLNREFGSLKGFVKYMADDFNAPLDEFKDYM